METRWMTADEITEKNLLSTINLVANVRSGALTAYEYHSFLPVDWASLEQRFNEIKKMSGQQIPGTKRQNVRSINPYTGQPTTSSKNVPCQVAPINILPDQWQDAKGVTRTTPRRQWAVLHDALTQQARPSIPESQYKEILDGWGSLQYESIIFESVFLESDVLRITTPQQPKEDGKTAAELAQILNSNHPWYSEPLAIAVHAWIELYSTRGGNKDDNTFKPKGGNTRLIDAWLTENVSGIIGPTTRAHYRFIINPGKVKGPQKIQDE